jgi:cysteinyl-tRNA synthetase
VRAAAVRFGVVLHLYDTATQQVRELALREPGEVGIYLCGPTVYGPPHLGHGRATIVYDILRRYLTWTGLRVRLVSNITDIDDAIINRAKRESRDPADIATKCEAVWFDAMTAVGVARPDHVPHATEYVEPMVHMIRELIDRDAAYVTGDGVYLSIASVPDYGLLAHQSLDDMMAGGGDREVVGADNKRHPADFVLWKFAKPGEPKWSSPWGDGRPGWHTECVVMSLDLLGEGFDLHCGGMDLCFPHHENERAQAVALGKRFANHWMHHAFIVDERGDKMAKSVGNVENLLDLIEQRDPRAYRLVLLQSHYRQPVAVGPERFAAAEAALGRIDALARRTDGFSTIAVPDRTIVDAFRERMDDDLDTPGAMAAVFGAVTSANAALDAGDDPGPIVAALREMLGAIGLVPDLGSDVPPDVAARAADLDAARAAKDFAAADAIRAELQAAGWVVETTKAGTTVRR